MKGLLVEKKYYIRAFIIIMRYIAQNKQPMTEFEAFCIQFHPHLYPLTCRRVFGDLQQKKKTSGSEVRINTKIRRARHKIYTTQNKTVNLFANQKLIHKH